MSRGTSSGQAAGGKLMTNSNRGRIARGLAPLGRPTPKWLHDAVRVISQSMSTLISKHKRTLLYGCGYDLMTMKPQPADQIYLTGDLSPVHDELLQEVPVVEGKLPEDLEGCFVRNGPNPFLKPTRDQHWFDGDGMLHLVHINNGRALYCNRFIETDRLKQERAAGRPLFLRMGDMCGLRGLALVLLESACLQAGEVGSFTANISIVYHAGRLLALHEGDLPYVVRVLHSGLIETTGRLQMESSWTHPFTAHPKKDPLNGELLFLGYRLGRPPYISMGIMTEHGSMTRQWAVDIPRPVMMHDMAATERYLVILDLPICFEAEIMIKDKKVPFRLRKDIPSRIGLLRRDQPSCPEGPAEVQWFELPGPGFAVFHVATAWEDANGDVRVFACQLDDMPLGMDLINEKSMVHLTEYTVSPATGAASVRRLSEIPGEFPIVHPGKVTRPCKWSWLSLIDKSGCAYAFSGLSKMDLAAAPGTDACVGILEYPPGSFGGEAVFIPRKGATAEDDGYLAVYVHDAVADVSHMNLYDARSMSPTPVASLRMPRRVPLGLHGAWLTQEQLQVMLKK